MTFLPNHLLKNTAVALLIAAGSTLATGETASAQLQKYATLQNLERLCPDHTFGDGEFAGHGPNVEVTATLSIVNGGRSILAHVTANFEEHMVTNKRTYAAGNWQRIVYTSPPGEVITGFAKGYGVIASSLTSTWRYHDRDHYIDLSTGEGEFVTNDNFAQFRVMGDTKGRDVGRGCIGSYVTVIFNQIVIAWRRG